MDHTTPPTVTAVVLTKNEARHIGACLATLAWADEQLVVDSGSRDATVDLARAAGARVIVHPFRDFAAQRNFALDQVATEWVLFVDADERVTPELAAEIRRATSDPLGPAGYWIPRRNIILGRWMRHTGWSPDYQLRLFRPDRGRYAPERPVHETVDLDGPVGYLTEPFIHLNYERLSQFLVKQIHYSRLEARRLWAAGQRPRLRSLIGQPLREFQRRYIIWQGYRDGSHGALLSGLLAWFTLVTYLRLYWLAGRGWLRDRAAAPEGAPREAPDHVPLTPQFSGDLLLSAASSARCCVGEQPADRAAQSDRARCPEPQPLEAPAATNLPSGTTTRTPGPTATPGQPLPPELAGREGGKPAVSVIIVSYNVRDLLAECLASVRAELARWGQPGEILVIDNASTDGSAELPVLDEPDVRTIRNAANVGFARAVNQALALARGESVLLLNPDARLLPGSLPRLVEYLAAHPEVAVVGPRLLNADGSIQSSRRRFPTLLTGFIESTRLERYFARSRHMRRYYAADLPDDRPVEVDWLVGACLLIRRAAIESVGGLDERFFMYFEEVDWCLRLRRAGWRIVSNPAAQVIHHDGRSAVQDLARRQIHFDTSKRAYYRKHFGPGAALALRIFLGATYLFQTGEEAVKLALGHKPALRRERLAAWRRILGSA